MSKKIKSIFLILILLLTALAGFVVIQKEQSASGVPILGYHGVVNDKEKEQKYRFDQYTLSKTEFERQLKYLKQNHFQTLTLEQLSAYYRGEFLLDPNKRYVALTFDDGLKNYKQIVEPLLKKYQMHASCFVISKKLELDNPKFLSKKDIQNSKYSRYYSHSYDLHHHCGWIKKKVECSSKKQLVSDFKKDQKLINNRFIAYPYGRKDDDYVQVLKDNNVQLAFSYNNFHNFTQNDNPYAVPRYLMFSKMSMWHFKWLVG